MGDTEPGGAQGYLRGEVGPQNLTPPHFTPQMSELNGVPCGLQRPNRMWPQPHSDLSSAHPGTTRSILSSGLPKGREGPPAEIIAW